MKRLAAVFLSCLASSIAAGQSDHAFDPDTPHYFEHFDPAQKPWLPGQELNVEEVFKNYQYYEIRWAKGNAEIVVTRYVHNARESGERYHLKPDGTLEKLAP